MAKSRRRNMDNDSVNFMQVVEQTYEEKMKMYMKCTKKQLCEMLIECNRILELYLPITDHGNKDK